MSYRVASLVCALVCASAIAQNNRSAVSVLGNDSNACTVQSPCRSFSKAITVTNAGGELLAIDSGGYGPFEIDRAVTVRPVPGAYAGITVASGDGIFIATASGDVILRGITLNGIGASTNGINFVNGHSLIVENCSIDRMTNNGIASVDRDGVFISDTTVTGCTTAGIQIGNGSSTVNATIVNSRVLSSHYGVVVYQGGIVMIKNSAISRNDYGVYVSTSNPATLAVAVLESSMITGNTTGIQTFASNGTSTIDVSNCTISGNSLGTIAVGGGTTQTLSRSNNTLDQNATNGNFTGTYAVK